MIIVFQNTTGGAHHMPLCANYWESHTLYSKDNDEANYKQH